MTTHADTHMPRIIRLAETLLPRSLYRLCRDLSQPSLSHNFVCPICRQPAKELLQTGENHAVLREKRIVGAGVRKAVCPSCHSTDRERLVYLYVEKKLANTRRKVRLLHVAPEPNVAKTIKSMPNVLYISADISAPSDIKFDLVNAPFSRDTFDIVICNHVLEHILDDKAAMAEIYRILKPGGWAVLQVPLSLVLEDTFEDPHVISPEDRARIFGQNDHVRIYSRQDYRRRLEAAGFKLTIHSSRQIGGYAVSQFGLAVEEELYVAAKDG